MKLKIKKKVKGQWENFPLSELKGQNICNAISDSFELAIGGAYDENEELFLVLTNKQSGIDMYDEINKKRVEDGKKEVLCLLTDEAIHLFGETPPNMFIETFPDSDFIEVKTCSGENE